MRRWATLVLAGWIGMIAVHTHAAATESVVSVPSVGAMDCCPSEKPDCPDPNAPEKGCVTDAACMARCTFIQPALTGPALMQAIDLVALHLGSLPSAALLSQPGYPPERPPKNILHV